MAPLWHRHLTLSNKVYLYEVVLIITSIVSLVLAMDVSSWFTVPFFLGILICGTYVVRLRCPTCGMPIIKNELTICGVNTHIWKPFPLRKCSKCGEDFTTCR